MSSWPAAPLGTVCNVVGGGTPSRDKPEFFGGDIPWITPTDVTRNDGRYLDIGAETITELGLKNSSAKLLPARSVLLTSRATIGFTAINTVPVSTNQGFASFVCGPDIWPEFLAYWLEWQRDHLIGLASGATFKEINKSTLKRLPIPLPPLEEQRRIVGLLDRAAEIRRRADAARAKARAIIPALFLDTFGDPATNPKGWAVVMIGEAGEVKLGRQRAPKYQSGKFTRPYVRVANVFENMIDVSDLLSMDFDERDYANYRLSYGDILLNEGQSIELVGRPAMWRDEVEDCCFQNTLVRFRCDPAKIVPDFALAAYLRMYHDGHLSKIASKTSNVAHLGAGRFAKLPIVLPPIPLQTAFAEQAQRLNSLARHLDAAAAKAEAKAAGLSAEVFGAGERKEAASAGGSMAPC